MRGVHHKKKINTISGIRVMKVINNTIIICIFSLLIYVNLSAEESAKSLNLDLNEYLNCLPAGQGVIFEAAPIDGARDFHPGHLHAGVFFAGTSQKVVLTYFRSGNTLEKARILANALNEIFAIGFFPNIEVFPPNEHPPFNQFWGHLIPKYSLGHSSKWSIWAVEYDNEGYFGHPSEIFLVDGGELYGHINRAPGGKYFNLLGSTVRGLSVKRSRKITSELVAYWWKAYVGDLLSMVMCSQPPDRTIGTFAGSIYEKLYERAREPHPSGLIELNDWKEIFRDLTFSERRALNKPGQFIPANFTIEHNMKGDH